MPDPRLRSLGPADLAILDALEQASQAQPGSRRQLAEVLADARRVVLGIEVEGRLVGQAVVARQPFDAELESIAVSPGWRRRGLAHRLLEAVIEQARAWGGERLLLEVRAGNVAALTLYRRAGWHEDGRRRGYYPPWPGEGRAEGRRGEEREDAVLMSRRL
ncbi:GNAT family N-acetyltransferase [Halomonas cerina]|uniref:Ribosomal-protein-alanine N-acetyltransferase n=1 Tax=Halomonas cerina TaxID=447424 RepID=A0A839VAR3_9GAMM|nr:GNAT family N-acetyltransferase [Halomonas cerina]MBB3191178.1 ribosomal-protein-alanine N-acetyltransferase [Halomonas cerina]